MAINHSDQVIDQDLQSFRPQRLSEFIGHNSIKENLKTFINSAKIRKKALDHVMISGPPGLGKTTLNQIIARELSVDITSTTGPLLEKQGDLAAILTSLDAHQVLFIDEAHRMNPSVEEVLYNAMEDYKLDIIVGQGPGARTVKLDLPPFTLIGATTRLGMLSGPLRDRFGIQFRLDYYEPEEMIQIVNRSAKLMNIAIDEDAAEEIGRRSRGTPRVANRNLKRCHDYAVVAGKNKITLKDARKSLDKLNIDHIGLDLLDHRYLEVVGRDFDCGPVGLTTIAAALSEDKATIENTSEAYLMRLGLIKKTSQGRVLTTEGRKHISDKLRILI